MEYSLQKRNKRELRGMTMLDSTKFKDPAGFYLDGHLILWPILFQ